MPSRKIYCPGCGTQMLLGEKDQTTQCKKCKITIALPTEWFQPPNSSKNGTVTPFKPTVKVELEPQRESPHPPKPLNPPQANAIEQIRPEIKNMNAISNEELEPNICSRCGNEMPTSIQFQCSNCGNKFCLRCPGRHIPPGERALAAVVKYKYRMRGASQWRNEQTKFNHNLPLVLCPDCYDAEFNKGLQILEGEIRTWYQGLVQDEDARISEKNMPKMCQSISEVKKE